MEKFLKKFEQWVSYVLIAMVIAYISFQIIVLVFEAYHSYFSRVEKDSFTYTNSYGRNVFVTFFNILLALEVLETVKIYNKQHDLKIRIILIVCMIAVSRKILSIEIQIDGPQGEFAVAALVVSLSLSYYLIIKSSKKNPETEIPESTPIQKIQEPHL